MMKKINRARETKKETLDIVASFEKFKKKKGRNISSERIIGSLRLRLPLEGKNLSSECLSPVWRLRCLLFIHVLKAGRIKSHKDDASPESETSSSSFDRLPQLPVCLVLFIGNSLTPSLRGSLPTYLDIKILGKKNTPTTLTPLSVWIFAIRFRAAPVGGKPSKNFIMQIELFGGRVSQLFFWKSFYFGSCLK